MVRTLLVWGLALGVTLAALWFGCRSTRLLRFSLRALRALRPGRGRPLGQLSPGSVGLRGRVSAIDRLESPHSGREGVYLRCTVETWDNTPNILGATGRWICSAHSEEATPFELTDGETAVLVDPHGAEVLAPALVGHRAGATPPGRFTEALIAPDEELVVLGELTEQGGFEPAVGYRGSPFRRVIVAGGRGLLLATPRELGRRLAARLLLGLLGAGAALCVVVGAVVVASNVLPIIRVELPGAPVMTQGRPRRYTADYWLTRTSDAEAVGPGRGEAWVVGWVVGSRPERALSRRLERELWARQLNGLHETRRIQRRVWLLFELTGEEGTAYRRPAFWRSFCKFNSARCPPR